MRQKTRPSGNAVELVVVLAGGNGTARHIDVDHLARTGLQRHHRKRAGVGKQIQHLGGVISSASRHLRGNVVMHPAPPLRHVQKQAVVLPLINLHAKLRAPLSDGVRLGHAAGHQTRIGAAPVAVLKHPVQRRALGRNLLPALR